MSATIPEVAKSLWSLSRSVCTLHASIVNLLVNCEPD